MLNQIFPYLPTIVVGAVVVLIVVAAALKMLKDKKNNIKSCCSSCSGKSICHPDGKDSGQICHR